MPVEKRCKRARVLQKQQLPGLPGLRKREQSNFRVSFFAGCASKTGVEECRDNHITKTILFF